MVGYDGKRICGALADSVLQLEWLAQWYILWVLEEALKQNI